MLCAVPFPLYKGFSGRHAEPHTYRTHACIFSWSSFFLMAFILTTQKNTIIYNIHSTIVIMISGIWFTGTYYVRRGTTWHHTGQPMHAAYTSAIWFLRSISWSIDSCQNKASADHCHITTSRAQVKNSSRLHALF